jgi:hypothetical protein
VAKVTIIVTGTIGQRATLTRFVVAAPNHR